MTRGGNQPWRERRPVRRTCEPGPRSSRQTPATKVVADPHILDIDILYLTCLYQFHSI